MLKKKDPYIALLDFYYDRFPEKITLPEVYDFFYENGYLSTEELCVIKNSRSQNKGINSKVYESAINKKRVFEVMFRSAGHPLTGAGRNAPHVLNSEHYFHRLEYIELVEAKKSSRLAFIISLIAILISAGSLFIAWESTQEPMQISDTQIQQITSSIDALKND